MVSSFRDWAGLPSHIVDLMVVKLDSFSDYVQFSGVCPEWRHVALDANIDHKVKLDVLKASRRKLPLLMFKTDEKNLELRNLYDVSRRITYTIKLPIPYKNRFVGSSLGWLFCLEQTMVVTLVNPYNNVCISLPVFIDPRELFRFWSRRIFDYLIKKGILLSDPLASPDSFVVVVIYSGNGSLAFFKSGEPSWNYLDSDLIFSDIIYHKGELYGVSIWAQFVQIDVDSRTIKTIIPPTEHDQNNVAYYLVESQNGELLMVKRSWSFDEVEPYNIEADHSDHSEEDARDEEGSYNEDSVNESEAESYGGSDNEDSDNDSEAESYDTRHPVDPALETEASRDFATTYKFNVFKITDPTEEGSATWVEIKDIGQQALFVGDNHSVSVPTAEFLGCKPNSIDYTSDWHNFLPPYFSRGVAEDSGIFSLKNGCFSTHHVLGTSEKYVQPPIWFVPNPQ